MPLKLKIDFECGQQQQFVEPISTVSSQLLVPQPQQTVQPRSREQLKLWIMSLTTLGMAIAITNKDVSDWLSQISSPHIPRIIIDAPNDRAQQPKRLPNLKSVFPLTKKAPITDVPGSCRDRCTRIHAGTDYAYIGAVLNALAGRVVEVNPRSRSGGVIAVESQWNGESVKLRYVHLDRQTVASYKVGEFIPTGKVLGYIRETFPGSTGPHAHIEVYRNGRLDWKGYRFLAKL
ncbi:hypothetical protein WA1_49415 [Scytonema hofmannii PCC 7110]|uniref:M23ase beta-sheet core domain-containing protein n=1 Tax=Scytonema hofmannii PCC 7110 TaxID=128403 RepID=A0A139WQQ0_9CYAN|nr:M23 family metallopeptidase [Scytonema hofmannii]KYC34759.1 hypothetical protein WA1_49415 [Scytonema hofmannii PCC 7110]